MKRHWMMLLVLIPILLAGCDTGICDFGEAEDAREALEVRLVEFDGMIADIATPATAEDVMASVEALVIVRGEAASLDYPLCAEDSKAALLAYMDGAIMLLEQSGGLATDDDVTAIREAAGENLARFNQANFQMLQEARSVQE